MVAQKLDLLIDMKIVLLSLRNKVCGAGECFSQGSLLLNISGFDLCHLPHIFTEFPDVYLCKISN